MFKKIFGSKWVKVLISLALIYLAFMKVDVVELWNKLMGIDWWFVVLNVILSLISTVLVSFRWSILLIKKPKLKDVVIFAKSTLSASFYGLFFPSSVAADLLKWIIIDEKYPKIPKSKLLGSIVLDRFIGLSMFVVVGLIMTFFAGWSGVSIPGWIKLSFVGMFVGCVGFYLSLWFFDWKRILKLKFLKKFENLSELIDRDNLVQILKSALVSLVSQFFWICQIWFVSWYFNTGLSLITMLVFTPIISMILALPISFAGFGAREQLYLLFFGKMANSTSSILLTSAFSGVVGILVALVGGLVSLTPDFKRSIKSSTKP